MTGSGTVEPASNEIERLRHRINDLASLLSLPAMWSGQEATETQIVDAFVDVLMHLLVLDFAYVRLHDAGPGCPFEALRVAGGGSESEVRQRLAASLDGRDPHLFFTGLLVQPFSLYGDMGLLAAGSARPDFPTDDERLLLNIATNLATVGLQQARLFRERRQAEQALREQKEALESLNRVAQVLASELDLQRLVQSLTDAASELTGAEFGAFFYNVVNGNGETYQLYTLSGAPREAFAGFPMPRNTALFGPTFRGEGVIRIADVRQDPRFGKNPPYFGMPQGHLPVVSYLAAPVISRSGEILGGLFFGHRLPGQFGEQAERLLVGLAGQAAIAIDNARLFQEAQQAVRLRDDFLSIAAHELKTPLTTIKGYSQLLRREFEAAAPNYEALREFAADLSIQIGRFEALVQDLLDVSRIQAGRLELRPERFDLVDLARDVLERFEQATERTENHILVLAAPEPVSGAWDRTRIDEVLTNLVSNALKYSPDGGEVRIEVRGRDGWVEMTVRDQGIGIDEEDQTKLFRPFFRGHRDGSDISGTGLGLYITAQIVEQHGGTIAVASAVGAGTAITVRLPEAPPA